MRIIKRKTLQEFWEKNPDSEQSLKIWFKEAVEADWATPNEIKDQYSNASILKNRRVVFNICGNKYRLVVLVRYDWRMVYIRFLGTHKEYDIINAENI